MHFTHNILVKADCEQTAKWNTENFLDSEFERGTIDSYETYDAISVKAFPKETLNLIKKSLKAQKLAVEECLNRIDNRATNDYLKATYENGGDKDLDVIYPLYKLSKIIEGYYNCESYFYDVENCTSYFSKEREDEILNNDDYYLVSVDVHY